MDKHKFEGIITKAVGGNYYVDVSDGVLCCNARGVFRKEKISPCAGDNVVVCVEENSVPLITEIKERKNHIIRPPLANLDCALLVYRSHIDELFRFQVRAFRYRFQGT